MQRRRPIIDMQTRHCRDDSKDSEELNDRIDGEIYFSANGGAKCEFVFMTECEKVRLTWQTENE